ncbi:MAG: lamin tail domain-containing protein [Candidatus Pacebacteria bacterium]|nr:lamin tail domain-containing protein [Candidatus Paceibacterota bacterium]
MRTIIFSFALVCVFCIPVFVHGAVVINEIAWMGTAVSASDEWIELTNDGAESVSLSGWKLIADDGAPSISLSGSIASGGLYLLERTDDMSVPGVSADKIYSGDLGNVGETLRLLDVDGVVVDMVSGGSNWENIGGNNTTKDTPQRQADATWITGIPTPKAINTTTPSETPSDDEVAGTSTTATTIKKKVVTGGYKQVVFAYGGEDITGLAGATLQFEGYAVSDKNVPLAHSLYRWAYGDGGKGKGKEQVHTYEEPGTYIAILRVTDEHQKSQDKVVVTILPADVRIVSGKAGDGGYIEVQNNTTEDIDLSGWNLGILYRRPRTQDASFTMPEATMIGAGAQVRFSAKVTGLAFENEDTVVLQYPSGARVSTLGEESLEPTSETQ